MALERDQLSNTEIPITVTGQLPLVTAKAWLDYFQDKKKHLLSFTFKQPRGKTHRRLWTCSRRGIAPSCHSGNTNHLKHQTGGKVIALNSADVHGFGNKLHYPKVECRVCPGLSTQELLKWLHSSVLRKYSLTKRAVPNCSILFPRYSLVYIGVEWYSKKKKKKEKKTKGPLFPLEQKLLLDAEHFGKYGKTSGAEVWFLGSWGLRNQALRLHAITFAIHHPNH